MILPIPRGETRLVEELTPAFLEELVARYETTARELGAEDLVFAERLRAYFAARPAEVRRQLALLTSVDPAGERPAGLDRRPRRRRAPDAAVEPDPSVR